MPFIGSSQAPDVTSPIASDHYPTCSAVRTGGDLYIARPRNVGGLVGDLVDESPGDRRWG